MTPLKPLIIFLLLILFYGCQEIYQPERELDDSGLPVIHAVITDKKGNSQVEITRLAAFGSYRNEAITDARVRVNAGDVIIEFQHTSHGIYRPVNPDFVVKTGIPYVLIVEAVDGAVITSEPVYLASPPILTDIYAEITENQQVMENPAGNPFVKKQNGLQLFFDVESQADTTQYYRCAFKILNQYVYDSIYPRGVSPVYQWEIEKSGNIDYLQKSIAFNNKNVAWKFKNSYLYYKMELYEGGPDIYPQRTTIFSTAWIVQSKLFSMNRDVYLYYFNLNKLLDAEDRVFDPVPSQVNGNLYYKENMRQAQGIFEVSSINTNVHAFQWKYGWSDYHKKVLEDYKFPDGDGYSIFNKPLFWVDF